MQKISKTEATQKKNKYHVVSTKTGFYLTGETMDEHTKLLNPFYRKKNLLGK